MLVIDLADELFEDVFERDDPGGAAILVDHRGKLASAAAQLRQQLFERLRFGHGNDRADELVDRCRRPRPVGHGVDVLGQHDADDIVEIIAVDRIAGVAVRRHGGGKIGHSRRLRQRNNIDARHERVRRGLVTETDRARQQLGVAPTERTRFARRTHERCQLLQRRYALELFDRLDTDSAHEAVGGAIGGGDQRRERGIKDPQRNRERQGRALGPGDGDVLGHELGTDQLRHGDEDQRRGDRQAMGRRHAEDVRERTTQRPGEQRLGEEPNQDRRERHADLCAREVERQPAEHRFEPNRSSTALFGGQRDAWSIGGDHRELDRDEGAVQRQEQRQGKVAEQRTDNGADLVHANGFDRCERGLRS